MTRGGRRTPSAHLTIARRAGPDAIAALRDQRLGTLGVGWRVEAIELVRSRLDPRGVTYETLVRSAL